MSRVLEFASLRVLFALCLCSIAVLAIDDWERRLNEGALTEKRLMKSLLKNYTTMGNIARPVLNFADTVVVRFGVDLIEILDVDLKSEVLTTHAWLKYAWYDQLLRWDPKDFDGISMVRLPASKIWMPDIVLYNNVEEKMIVGRDFLAVVQNDGKVLWIPQAILKIKCQIDTSNFPYDQQLCRFKFGSWTYDFFKLDMEPYGNKSDVGLDNYVVNNEWTIAATTARKTVMTYPCCEEPYPSFSFYVALRRNPGVFNVLLVLPCVLLTCLILVTFWLPPDLPSKTIIGFIIFFGFLLLLYILAYSIPSASSTAIPFIGKFYCFNMVLVTSSIIVSVITLNFGLRKHTTMTPRVRKIFYVIARCLFMRHAPVLADRDQSPHSDSQELADSGKVGEEKGEIHDALKLLQTRGNIKDAKTLLAREWRVVSYVMDRLFFYIYLVVIIVAAVIILRSRDLSMDIAVLQNRF